MQEAYIVAGYRTAVGKANRGGFKNYNPVSLSKHVIDELMKTVPQLEASQIDDLIVGNAVPEAEQGLQMARWIAVNALGIDVPGVTVNRYCGSGVETVAMATAKIRAGMADCIIAGGAESMSMVPIAGYRTVPVYDLAKSNPEYMLGMGHTAEKLSQKYNISREAQDEFSYNSHKKAIDAIQNGRFKDEIVPVEVDDVYYADGQKKSRKYTVDTDEGPRADTSKEVLAKLRSVFSNGGTVTAGNSSQTSDGAAFTIVMSEKMVNDLGLTPIARMVTCTCAGVDPSEMGIGPVKAIPKDLKIAGMSLGDIDLIELNEAFAAQALAVVQEAGLDMDTLNVNGGAVALGHPLGCTGTKLTVQIINELRRRNKKYGMVTACIGGGQGIAGIYELLN